MELVIHSRNLWSPALASPLKLVFNYAFSLVLQFLFCTGLVQLRLAGLPLRSCWIIGAQYVQGDIPMSAFRQGERDLEVLTP